MRNPLNKDTSIYLHHNYIASVLNDVFGIQVRGGCVCAGPYAQSLLGMDETLTDRFEQILVEDQRLDRVHLRRQHESSQYEILRPGFVRFRTGFEVTGIFGLVPNIICKPIEAVHFSSLTNKLIRFARPLSGRQNTPGSCFLAMCSIVRLESGKISKT